MYLFNLIETSPFPTFVRQELTNTMLHLDNVTPDVDGSKSPIQHCLSNSLIHEISPTTPKNHVFMRTADVPIATEQEEERGAALLLSVAAIVTKEIDKGGVNWEDDDLANFPMLPNMDPDRTCQRSATLSPRCSGSPLPSSVLNTWNRIRSVSIDIPEDLATYRGEKTSALAEAVVSPSISPVSRRFPLRKAALLRKRTTKQESPKNHKRTLLPPKSVSPGHSLKTILRKKFSWKNFPEVSYPMRMIVATRVWKTYAFSSFFSWKHFLLPTVKNTSAIPL